MAAGPSVAQNLTRVLGAHPAIAAGSSRSVNWADTDGDGDLDLFVSNGGTLFENDEYYRNDGGVFVRDMTAAIALDSLRSDGATWGDYDNDGDPDLFVVSWYGEVNALFDNLGGGSFARVTTGPAVNTASYSEGAAWVDYDADGDLDLYVTNSGTGTTFRANLLYRNDGGALVEVTTGPLVNDNTISRQASWADYDDDGDVDVFIANEAGQNNELFRNRLVETGIADFEAVNAGALTNDGGDSFSASWGDYDNDGDFDLIVANFSGEPDFVYRNELAETGMPTFVRVLDQGPAMPNGWTVGTHWADWDNDGDLDLMVTNGFAPNPSTLRRNFYYRNDGGALIRDQTSAASSDSGWAYGAAWGDSDGDGDLDLCIANWMGVGQVNGYYVNGAQSNGNHWLTFDCIGVISNRSGIGCKITATATIGGNVVTQVRQITGSDGYCSHTLRGHFGLGDATVIDVLTVRWPNRGEQVLTNVPVDAHLQIVEDTAVDVPSLPSQGSVDGMRIEHVAPNPFRGSTSIRYALASDVPVRLSIVDPAGRRVRQLENGMRSSGVHEFAWDGRDDRGARVATGVYFVDLSTVADRATQRVLLVR
ncbi:MAG: FG-GAP-like repeat-containing protein [bacterium]